MCMCMRMHVHVCMCMYAYAQVTPALLASAVDEPISRPRDDFSPPEVRPNTPTVHVVSPMPRNDFSPSEVRLVDAHAKLYCTPNVLENPCA